MQKSTPPRRGDTAVQQQPRKPVLGAGGAFGLNGGRLIYKVFTAMMVHRYKAFLSARRSSATSPGDQPLGL